MENKGFLRVRDKLLGEAEAEAKSIMDKAEAEVKEYETAKQSEAESYFNEELEKIELERQLLEDKMLAQARLDSHKRFLSSREELIEKLIQQSIQDIRKNKEYKNFMKKLLTTHKSVLKQPLTLYVNSKDVSLAKELLASTKIKGSVKTSEINGGMVLEGSSGKRIQESITSRLERSKDDIRTQLSKIIKGE